MKTLYTIYTNFAKNNMAKFLTVLTILFTVGVGSMLGAEKTITLTYSDFGLTTSYAQKTATVNGVGFTVDQGYKGTDNVIQMNSSKGNGVLYNTTSIPGLKSITVNVSSGDKTYTITSGTAQTPSGNSQTGTTTKTFSIPSEDTYFQLKVSGASYFSSIVITYDDGNSGGGSDECTWTLVTDASTLQVGDRVVIAAAGYNYAMGNNSSKGEYRTRTAITKNGNEIAITDDVQTILLEDGTKSNTFALNVDDAYLYAASSSDNHLKTKNTLDDNGSWSITIANSGVATIKAQGTNTRNWIRYNANSNQERFSCYGSGQNDVVIYKEVCNKETTIKLYPNFGTELPTTITTGAKNYTIPACEFTRTGYNFSKWNTEAAGTGNSYEPETEISLNGTEVNLYAQWTPIQYLVYTAQWFELIVTQLQWSEDAYTAALEADNDFPDLTISPSGVEGKVTYQSSDPAVATIASDGTITLVGTGTTTITASIAADETYLAASDSYELTVVESNCKWVETEIGDIQPEDVVVVTMGNNERAYALGTEKIKNSPKAQLITITSGIFPMASILAMASFACPRR